MRAPSTLHRRIISIFASVLAVTLGVVIAPARAQEGDSHDEWTFENVRLRFAFFEQEGAGYQSQDAPDSHLRGGEHALIFQPAGAFRVRQNENVTHDVTIPIDIVSAASPDAIDVMTTASRENEAGSLDVVSTVRTAPNDQLVLHWGAHFEEYWGTGFLGASFARSFADDNATLRTGVEVIYDSFDAITWQGIDPGPVENRLTASLSSSLSQLLSPTTIVSGTYTFTSQVGRLETTYNSVPVEGGTRVSEKFPHTRSRHTFAAELRQAIPRTHTVLGVGYRFYVDTFDATAHTAQATLTQYLGDFWLSGHYRFHHQTAPWFWTDLVASDAPAYAPRTGDSDLETLDAQEVGLTLRWFFDRKGALSATDSFIQLGYVYYWRSNSLDSHIASIDFGYDF